MIKQIMIPVAAFAVTATAASAFSGDLLAKLDLDLSDDQVIALEEAHELRLEGAEREEIKTVLEEAGIDKDTMKEIRSAAREYRKETRSAIKDAVAAGDYSAFLLAVEDVPALQGIDSVEEFERLMEAHELREAGDREGAKEILSELDIEPPHKFGKRGAHRGNHE